MDRVSVNEFIAGGYFVTKALARSDYMSAELLPDRIISASNCIADMAPDVWAVRWASCKKQERKKEAAKFGLTPAGLRMVVTWVTDRMDVDEIGWPGVFYSTATARQFAREYLPHDDDLILIGIGLHREHAEVFLTEEKPRENEGVPGVYASLSLGKSLEPEGDLLGFEVLGYESGSFHSWLCNSLEVGSCREFGIRPNSIGLLDTVAEAIACTEYALRDEIGAEPALWQPWLVVRYSLS